MRAAFRKLGTLTLMAWGFLFSTHALAATPYRLSVGGYFGIDPVNACLMLPLSAVDARSFPNSAYGWRATEVLPQTTSSGLNNICQFRFSHPSYSSTKTGNGTASGVSIYAYSDPADSCGVDEDKILYFSGAVVQINGQSLAAVDPPSQFCQKGCNYNRQSNHNSCSINGDKSTCSYTFVSDGSACNTASSDTSDPSEKPEDFDSGTGSGGSGDGDTGGTGGDSGGCASGIGCDNGSGSGGGDSGGGDSGGDSGGGDTGGGDSGGGDTGGGDTGGGGTGTTGGATSADIRNLGDRITNAIAGHYNSLASSIAGLGDRLTGKLDQLGDKVDQLNGPAFSEGDVPGEAGGTAPGSDAGNDLAGQITDAVDQAVAEREAGLRDDLGTIDGMVSDWFGPSGNNIDSNDLLGSMFPAPSGCRDYVLPVHRDIVLTLPVCRLAAIKPLLEWVFAVLTAIGVWRILMNGLLGSAGRSTSGRR